MFNRHKHTSEYFNMHNIYAYINWFIKSFDTIEQKKDACDYLISIFRMEYIATSKTAIFREKHPESCFYSIPYIYYLADGTECILEAKSKKSIPLTDQIAVAAWHGNKLISAFRRIGHNKFVYDSSNHDVEYYTCIDIAAVRSGRHSITAGTFFYDGAEQIPAAVYDISELFEHVDVNEINWLNAHTGGVLQPIGSRYIAILYYIAKLKTSLE